MDVNGWYTPLPYPDEVTSEHGASAASVPHQSCTTHPEKNSWGDHIYADTVSLVRLVSEPPWIENKSPLVLSETTKQNDLGNSTLNLYQNTCFIKRDHYCWVLCRHNRKCVIEFVSELRNVLRNVNLPPSKFSRYRLSNPDFETFEQKQNKGKYGYKDI